MDIQTRMHTIFMLVGATECGKSTFATKVLIPQLKLEDMSRGLRTNVQYLSSDSIRQELLGYAYDKYDQVMLEASSHTFQLLFERLRLVTSFPINADFVVVDTIGLADDFRSKVRQIAQDNNYNLEVILFDYRKREDYYASERSKKLISNHLNRLRKEVLPVLSREGYSQIHKVRSKDFYLPEEGRANPAYRVTVQDWSEYAAAVLPQQQSYIVVGDVHECMQELQGLLRDYGYRIDNGKLIASDKLRDTRIILAGDWIDKGKQTRAIIDFLYQNREHFLLVLGNHENFVYKYIKGEIAGIDPELLETYFDSVPVLSEDAELFERFAELVESSKPFFRYVGMQGSSFYVTHAPCRNKYIGKLDSNSARHQRNFRLDREGEVSVESQLAFLGEEAVNNHPYHLFGHIAAKQSFRIKNKLHLDTGCAHGNALTSVRMTFKPMFKSHKSQSSPLQEELPTLFRESRKVSVQELEDDAVRRLRYSSRNRINYISGTMSPADKDEAAGELESLRRGLDYFADRGVTEVVLQPKYMGSRCNVYLHRELEQCFAISRNGYKVRAVDLQPIYLQLHEKLGSYMEREEVEMIILDGELLPWKALGEGLIERQFKPIGSALESELDFLRKHGFEDAFGGLVQQYEASGFEQDQHHLAKNALSDKYGARLYQNYRYVREVRESQVPLDQHDEAYRVYKRQLELYAGDAELTYKPFAILKEVLVNGEERMPTGRTSQMYQFLNDDACLVLDLKETDAFAQAERFFAKLTVENQMEGVVIKPEFDQNGSTVPYMKVRNPGYLSIIYGYDYKFPRKYSKLMKQKNIASKLRTSTNEYRLGQQMLAIKLRDIAPENGDYMQVAANLLFEVAKEKEIDPRL
ncbi:polynucleotide kinase-phosphatase [Paenibacillus sp. CCS19]|uniref:metallophosphoesterase n=1 Tax=Paenibacillus sp. CCS19 TaxID=3158387 RepID=UPI00256BF0FC|nr:metallophosphoesterase [Paenibacillus cellulosilyticus]GMK42287.1 polynucleotide kinase-phosphatase [Paenibacillus cellulosilyticus]